MKNTGKGKAAMPASELAKMSLGDVGEGSELFPLLSVPSDVALHILTFLTGADVCAVACTCTALNAIATDPSLWSTLIRERFGQVRMCALF